MLRQNVTKLDSVRAATRMPYACPKCDEAMNHRLHDEVWPHFKMCYKCVNEVHKKIRSEQGWSEAGWQDYVKEIKKANFQDWLKDVKEWGPGESRDSLEKEFETQLEKLDEKSKKVLGD